MAWGAKVSPTFRERVRWIANTLKLDANDLMTCMAWESGRTFSPSKKNLAGSGATGLIQFMPATARGLGTTTAQLAKMTAEDQLNFVYKYFRPWDGKLKNLSDTYMAILWPKAVGQPEHYVLWDKAKMPTTFRQNAGLDLNKDGRVTKAECSAKLYAMKAEGLKPGNMA
ncbi:MAG TPA: lytic transglycosylase [Chloroflexota bacterium]|nr:lytic transglycosylase [Chloroflexota bacterium]